MKQSIEDQIDIFNILHDGCLINIHLKTPNVHFEVQIEYLARLVNPTHRFFKGTLERCSEITFEAWSESAITITDINEIDNLDLQILDAKKDDQVVKVSCICRGDKDYYGGILSVKAESVLIYDQGMNPISLEELDELCNAYWNRWSEEGPQ